jgi:hypothetical protein
VRRSEVHGLPPEVDLSFFRGCTLLQVCIGQNEVILNFDPPATVTVVTAFLLCRRIHANGEPGLPGLLGEQVEDVQWRPDGTLTLLFPGGQFIQLCDDSEQYESYVITHGNRTYAV